MGNAKRPGLKLGARTERLLIGDEVLKEHVANPRTQDAVAAHCSKRGSCSSIEPQAADVRRA
jgi:hypothetical protein